MKILICLTLILLFSACQNHKPQYRHLIAYNVAMNTEQSDYDIWLLDSQTKHTANITKHEDVAWSYASTKENILFVSDRDTTKRHYYLYSMNIHGDKIRKISDYRLADSWMDVRHNGTEIIVKPHHSVDKAFYLINFQGEILNKIKPELAYFNDPTFSPDGTQIAFRGAEFENKKQPNFIDEIYIMNIDGTGLKKLSEYPVNDTTAKWYEYKAGPPKWHPTENFISYQSKQNNKYSLYAVSTDGLNQWKLTNNNFEEGYHDWSLDGLFLAIETFDENQSQYHISLMNWQTKKMNQLTDSSYNYQQAPVFVE
jgi:TolB protein